MSSAYRTSGYKVIIETVVLLLGRSSLELPQGKQYYNETIAV